AQDAVRSPEPSGCSTTESAGGTASPTLRARQHARSVEHRRMTRESSTPPRKRSRANVVPLRFPLHEAQSRRRQEGQWLQATTGVPPVNPAPAPQLKGSTTAPTNTTPAVWVSSPT